MSQIYGFIERSGRDEVKIRTETGGVLYAPSRPDLTRGTKVEIDYDYTKNEIHTIWVKGTRPKYEPCKELDIDELDLDTLIEERCDLIKVQGIQDFPSLPLVEEADGLGPDEDLDTESIINLLP